MEALQGTLILAVGFILGQATNFLGVHIKNHERLKRREQHE